MHIRNERPADAERIERIQYAAFKGHPMHKPGAEPTEHLIVERLRADNELTLSLLAELEGQAVGHIAFSPASVGEAGRGWHLLGPVGVLPENQDRGVGSMLIREGLERLRDQGSAGVVLVGDPDFYARFGFQTVPGLVYPGVPGQYVLALPFTSAVPQGEITTHSAFAAPNDE